MIKTIDHLYAETNDFAKSQEFWRALGFKIDSQWGQDDHQACQMSSGGAKIVLATPDHNQPMIRPTVHFFVDNIEEMYQKIKHNLQVDILTHLEKTHWGTRWIRVKDVDQNVFVLESY